MRISTPSLYQNIKNNISQQAEILKKIEEKVASGKNMNRLSDNPSDLVTSLNLRNTLERIGQYESNMDMGEAWLTLSATVLEQGADLADRAQDIADTLGTGSETTSTLSSLALELDEIINEALDLANTKLSDKYIFAGYRTGTTPFTLTTIAGVDTVQYNGDTNDFKIAVGVSESLTVGKDGQEVWMDSGLFTALLDLKQAIADNDLTAIQAQAEALQTSQDYLEAQVADVGVRANQLSRKQEVLSQLNLTLEDQLDDLENVDYNKVIVELQQQQTAYQVALQVSAMVSEVSLLNYLD